MLESDCIVEGYMLVSGGWHMPIVGLELEFYCVRFLKVIVLLKIICLFQVEDVSPWLAGSWGFYSVWCFKVIVLLKLIC